MIPVSPNQTDTDTTLGELQDLKDLMTFTGREERVEAPPGRIQGGGDTLVEWKMSNR